jgi:hypothetical protein
MRFRKLRIAWPVFCGIACVLLVVLWVRSYWWSDFTHRKSPINICSIEGKLLIGCTLTHVSIRNPTLARRANPPKMNDPPIFGFYPASMRDWVFTFATHGLALPYWLCVIVLTLMTAAPWVPSRFSLRTLLIATTLIAVALGVVVWLR